MSDVTPTNDLYAADGGDTGPSRLSRTRRAKRVRWAVIGTTVLALLIAASLLGGRWYGSRMVAPPPYVVVVGESLLEDGSATVGVVAVIRRDGETYKIDGLDPVARRTIPGTSFDRLRDALAMGGADQVARLVAADIDGAEEPAWLLLEQPAWAGVLQAAGPTKLRVDEPSTTFTGDTLYRFAEGPLSLSGDEAAALALATESFEDAGHARDIRIELAEIVARAITEEPDAVLDAIKSGRGEYSGRIDQLENFLGS